MQFRDVVVGLLHSLGSRKEVSKYLEMFTQGDDHRCVLIKVGGGTIANELETLAPAIFFLTVIGMRPVIVHGGGPQLTRELEALGIDSEWIDGQRVTSPEVLAAARRVFQREGHRLAVALERLGASTRTLTSGVFRAVPADDPHLGLVGAVAGVHEETIRDTIDHGAIPVVSPLGETTSGQILNINADIATRELAIALRTQKVVFLTPEGGIRDERGAVISAINLEEDAERLLRAPWVTGGMALKLREITRTLDALPVSASISITSPEHLAAELFTHRGNGTFIRRGAPLIEINDFAHADVPRLRRVIERSFGRSLADDYFEREYDGLRVLIGGAHEAVAILRTVGGFAYLDKFAVSPEAKGHGLAGSLWRAIRERTIDAGVGLFWRSRAHNPINAWYAERADGMVRRDDWSIFWTGVGDLDVAGRLIDMAMAQPQDLSFATRVEAREVASV